MKSNRIFTIGHSNHPLEDFLKLLDDKGIKKLVDVRSAPYSKYSPHFNKNDIKKSLKENGVDYFYLGKKIGGRPSNESYYKDGKIMYNLVKMDENYKEGIKNLEEMLDDRRTVLMCSEEDPHKCHRHKLITPTLLKKGYNVFHIRGNGEIEEVKDRQSTLF
ncbi:MAG: DUF488 family protein [Methanobacterium sp.]|jgi:uncharacterized protein (DUF488 family)